MLKPFVIVIKDGVVHETFSYSTPELAEAGFTAKVKQSSAYDYTDDDIKLALEEGYEQTASGSVCLTWIDVK